VDLIGRSLSGEAYNEAGTGTLLTAICELPDSYRGEYQRTRTNGGYEKTGLLKPIRGPRRARTNIRYRRGPPVSKHLP
jgi:hypothetical protein